MAKSKKQNAKVPHQAHNNFLEGVFCEPKTLKSFVQQVLPEDVIQHIDLESIEPTNSHYVDANLRRYMSDLLIKIKKKDDDAFVYALIEHKSKAEQLTALQVMIYTFQAMLNHADLNKEKPLPMIYPIIIHHGKKKFSYPTNVWDLVDARSEEIEHFQQHGPYLLDLPCLSDEELLVTPFFPASFPELVLKHIYDPDLLVWFKSDPRVTALFARYAHEVGQKRTISALQYVHARAKISDVEEFARTVSGVDKVFGEEIMTAEQAAMNRGMNLGVQEGIQKGISMQQTLIASKMLSMGEPIDKISTILGLSIKDINRLASKQPEPV